MKRLRWKHIHGTQAEISENGKVRLMTSRVEIKPRYGRIELPLASRNIECGIEKKTETRAVSALVKTYFGSPSGERRYPTAWQVPGSRSDATMKWMWDNLENLAAMKKSWAEHDKAWRSAPPGTHAVHVGKRAETNRTLRLVEEK